MQSCQSQSNFDLSQISLNENIDNLHLEKLDLEEKDLYLSSDYSGYVIYDKEFLNYEGVNLEGRINSESNYERNKVSFWFSKENKLISLLDIDLYTHDECVKFLDVLTKKLGAPEYRYYRDKRERERENPTNYLWEDLINNRTYFLDVARDSETKKYGRAHLYVLKNSNTVLYNTMFDFPAYGYYKAFIKTRNEKQSSSYTYQQYVEDRVKAGRGKNETYYSK